jgi:hypothetical protein
MQSILIAIILALVVLGILLPALHRDIKATRESFTAPKPESALTRLFKKMKDHFKND